MAIEVTKKKKEVKLPKGLDVFFQIAIVLFIIVSAAYLFVIYLNMQAEEAKTEIERQIEEKKAEIPEKEELERIAWEHFNLIEDFKTVTQSRKALSPFFGPFEGAVHPSVLVLNLSVNPEKNEAHFSGTGRNLVAVGQQFLALKNREFVLHAELTDLAVVEREDGTTYTEFAFMLSLAPDVFKLSF